MPIRLNMGVEGVTYQPIVIESPADFPSARVHLPTGASIPRHVDRLFDLHAGERRLAATVAPSLANPYVTAPALYFSLFNDVLSASRNRRGEARQPGETARILASAHDLLKTMDEDFQAFRTGRNTLIEV